MDDLNIGNVCLPQSTLYYKSVRQSYDIL